MNASDANMLGNFTVAWCQQLTPCPQTLWIGPFTGPLACLPVRMFVLVSDALAGSSKNFIASDVMWSDPVNAPGLRPNEARGCGTVYGPDVTQVRLQNRCCKLCMGAGICKGTGAALPGEKCL